MTWKKSFFKTVFYDSKKRLWCTALFFILFFFELPVRALLGVQSIRMSYSTDVVGETSFYFAGFFTFYNIMLIPLIAAAVIAAMSGFSYLNSKKKVDFTHSMPIKRSALFLSRYVSGALCYMAPLIGNVLICLLLAASMKHMTVYLLTSALCFIAYQMVYFLLFYGAAILAVVLAGNFVVSLLGTGLLFSYQTILYLIAIAFKGLFFKTYMGEYQSFKVCDPIGLWIRQVGSFRYDYLRLEDTVKIDGAMGYYAEGWKVGLIALLGAAASFLIALFLFRIRKSENAGKSLVFPWSEPVVKIALLLPFGTLGGLVFYLISPSYSMGWYAFGAAVFFFLTAIVTEMVFRQDIKALFSHKRSALAGGALILLFTLAFRFDTLGYDSRIPKADRIESVGVSFPDIAIGEDYDTHDGDYKSETRSLMDYLLYYEDDENEKLNHCRITAPEEIEAVRALAAYYVKEEKEKEKTGDVKEVEVQMADMDEYGNVYFEGDTMRSVTCQVVYRLKNGENVYRSYSMDYNEDLLEVVEPVFACEEQKKSLALFLQDGTNYHYLYVQGNFADAQQYRRITKNDNEKLREVYWEDLKNMTFEEVYMEDRVASLRTGKLDYSYGGQYYLLGGFKNTLTFLREKGLESAYDGSNITIKNVDFEKNGSSLEQIALSEEEKQALIPYLIHSEFIAPGRDLYVEKDIGVVVEYIVNTEEGESGNAIEQTFDDADGLTEDQKIDPYGSARYQDLFYLKEVPDFISSKL